MVIVIDNVDYIKLVTFLLLNKHRQNEQIYTCREV